ncbi:hypothetical protein [Bartonella sp. B30(2025)]
MFSINKNFCHHILYLP